MTEYTPDMQKLFLEMMLNEPESFIRIQNIFNVENFDIKLQPAAEFIDSHSKKFNTLPTFKQIAAVTTVKLDPVPEDMATGHTEWFLEEFETFTKRQELERAIMTAADLLEDGDFGPVEKLIKDAVQISLTKDMGLDYFADPMARLLAIKANNGQMSTGWKSLDDALYGGFNRGELNIFTAGSGVGKSLFLQNLAVNWMDQGLNGLIITLELNEELTSLRIDSMITEIATNRIFKELDDVELKVKIKAKTSGNLRVKYLPAQSTINDIRSYVKELQIQTGIALDYICVDYLDLLMPVSVKVSPENLFVKDKYVSEELRNLGKELNVVMVTASQLNRGSVDETDFNHSHISGGISKINTADNVFGIYSNTAMKEQGRYQLQLMKTRSSNGVGKKIDLSFNVDTLRIEDTGLSPYDHSSTVNASAQSASIMNNIKAKSTVGENNESNQAKLKSLIGTINS